MKNINKGLGYIAVAIATVGIAFATKDTGAALTVAFIGFAIVKA